MHMLARSKPNGKSIVLFWSLHITMLNTHILGSITLTYGFQPRAPMDVGPKKEKLAHVKGFLQNLDDIFKIAKVVQNHARHYVDKAHHRVTFEEGEKVYLRIPKH